VLVAHPLPFDAYALSLHVALPVWVALVEAFGTAAVPAMLLIAGRWTDSTELAVAYLVVAALLFAGLWFALGRRPTASASIPLHRSEEHTSALQSREKHVRRLLPAK